VVQRGREGSNGWMEEMEVIEKTKLHPEFEGSGRLSIAIYQR
jgi:hypothetical protein